MHSTRWPGTSLETENEIPRVVTKINADKTSPQVVKVDNAVDEEQTINYLSSISYIVIVIVSMIVLLVF
jgi:hypothetical protein